MFFINQMILYQVNIKKDKSLKKDIKKITRHGP